MNLICALTAALAILSALSLLFKSETIRGGGRIIGGFAWIGAGAAMALVDVATIPALFTALAWTFIVCGLVTVGSGVNKFRNRHKAQ